MANKKHVAQLLKGAQAWNPWRAKHLKTPPDLREACLWRANLTGADLREARLWRANLGEANLGGANLTGADLTGVILSFTVFANTNMTGVEGLASCNTAGESLVDHLTFLRSGSLPHTFLRQCGLPEELIQCYEALLINDIVDQALLPRASPDQAFAQAVKEILYGG